MRETDQFPRDILIDWAVRTAEVKALCVFGSRAHGKALCNSDLDLAVELVASQDEEMLVFMDHRQQWIDELSELTGFFIKDLELIGVSECVKDPVEVFRRQ